MLDGRELLAAELPGLEACLTEAAPDSARLTFRVTDEPALEDIELEEREMRYAVAIWSWTKCFDVSYSDTILLKYRVSDAHEEANSLEYQPDATFAAGATTAGKPG